jgi:hypothetical protein
MLMIIYVAMKLSTTLTHRELIDMIMAVKETRLLSQLEGISKTKIRGILALFKQGQLFLTHGEEGEAVQLYLNDTISSFHDLREQHDTFVIHWMNIHHLFIPIHLKNEILWQLDNETKSLRLEELKGIETIIEHFFLSGGHQPYKTLPVTATSSLTTNKTTSGIDSSLMYGNVTDTALRYVPASKSVLPAPSLSVPASNPAPPVLTVPKAFINGGTAPMMTIPSSGSLSPVPDQQNFLSRPHFAGFNSNYQASPRQQEYKNLPVPPSSFTSTTGSMQLPTQPISLHREQSGSGGLLAHSFSSPRDISWYRGTEGAYGEPRNSPSVFVPATTPSPPIYDGRVINSGFSSVHSPRQERQPLPSPQYHRPEQLTVDSYRSEANDSYYSLQTERVSPRVAYDYEESPHQQAKAQQSQRYSPNTTFQQPQQQRPLTVYPINPSMDPATGGFMNRHYRPNRNKSNSESISHDGSINSNSNQMKSLDTNDIPGNRTSNEDLSKLTSSSSRHSSSSFSILSTIPVKSSSDSETKYLPSDSHSQYLNMYSVETALDSLLPSSSSRNQPVADNLESQRQQEFKG